ncbi:hypothetical protein VPH35_114244 [Triticum aestivum]
MEGSSTMTVWEVLYMYFVARQAYDRFISVCGNPEQARNAMALLDIVVRGVAQFLDGAGKFVFDDRLQVLLRKSESGLVGNPPEHMAPYSPLPVDVPEDCRSIFITFSKGMPLLREEIFDYFRQKWGECVVRVLMEKTTGGSMPMYGRIIFKTEAVVQLVLNSERLIKISIDQRQIWLRNYVPKPTNAADSSIHP